MYEESFELKNENGQSVVERTKAKQKPNVENASCKMAVDRQLGRKSSGFFLSFLSFSPGSTQAGH